VHKRWSCDAQGRSKGGAWTTHLHQHPRYQLEGHQHELKAKQKERCLLRFSPTSPIFELQLPSNVCMSLTYPADESKSLVLASRPNGGTLSRYSLQTTCQFPPKLTTRACLAARPHPPSRNRRLEIRTETCIATRPCGQHRRSTQSHLPLTPSSPQTWLPDSPPSTDTEECRQATAYHLPAHQSLNTYQDSKG
jgi:hypothetical protein